MGSLLESREETRVCIPPFTDTHNNIGEVGLNLGDLCWLKNVLCKSTYYLIPSSEMLMISVVSETANTPSQLPPSLAQDEQLPHG